MSQLGKDIQAAMRSISSAARSPRILKILHHNEEVHRMLEKAHERTERRRWWLRRFKRFHEDGKIGVLIWSRDCDMVEGHVAWIAEVDTAAKLDAWIERRLESAEGPMSFTLVSVREAEDFLPSSRDRALEAFEDGHPHVIY